MQFIKIMFLLLPIVATVPLLSTFALSSEPGLVLISKTDFATSKNIDCGGVGTECHEHILIVKIGKYTVKVRNQHFDDEVNRLKTKGDAVIVDKSNNVVASEIGGWRKWVAITADKINATPSGYTSMGQWHRPDSIYLVATPNTIPFIVFLSSLDDKLTYTFYTSTPTLKKVAEVSWLVSTYHTAEEGSSLYVAGFYKNSNGDILFDRLTKKRQKIIYDAPQKLSVETFKITKSGVISVRLEDYDFEEYRKREFDFCDEMELIKN